MTQSNATRKITVLSIAIIIVVAAIVVFYFKPGMYTTKLPKPVVINTKGQPTLGNPKAKVHLVAFEDLKCMNCARFNNTILPYVKRKYVNTGIAKYTMINLAFIPGSLPAANAARCVYEQNKKAFFPFVDYIYQHQPPENEDWATIPKLLEYAHQVKGVSTLKLGVCLIKSPYDKFFSDNMAIASKVMKNGIIATPTIYANGVLISPVSKSQFDKVIKAVQNQ